METPDSLQSAPQNGESPLKGIRKYWMKRGCFPRYGLYAIRLCKEAETFDLLTQFTDSGIWIDEMTLNLEYDLKGDTYTLAWLILVFDEQSSEKIHHMSFKELDLLKKISPSGVFNHTWKDITRMHDYLFS